VALALIEAALWPLTFATLAVLVFLHEENLSWVTRPIAAERAAMARRLVWAYVAIALWWAACLASVVGLYARLVGRKGWARRGAASLLAAAWICMAGAVLFAGVALRLLP